MVQSVLEIYLKKSLYCNYLEEILVSQILIFLVIHVNLSVINIHQHLYVCII